MVMRKILIGGVLVIILGWFAVQAVTIFGGNAAAEHMFSGEPEIEELASVLYKGGEFTLQIGLDADSGLLSLGVPIEGDAKGYMPLFVSTYRGIPTMAVNIYASATEDEIWVLSDDKMDPILGYYKIGSGTAITSFGEQALLTSALPESISGGGPSYPNPNLDTLTKLATVNHIEDP